MAKLPNNSILWLMAIDNVGRALYNEHRHTQTFLAIFGDGRKEMQYPLYTHLRGGVETARFRNFKSFSRKSFQRRPKGVYFQMTAKQRWGQLILNCEEKQ